MKSKTDQELFEHAKALYKQRRWKDSNDAFLQLVGNGVHASYGFYGMGLIRIARGDLAAARLLLLNCVRLQPKHGNAQYYLGEIARVRGEHQVAIKRYRRALAANPGHRGAKRRLAAYQRPNRKVVQQKNRSRPSSSKNKQARGNNLAPIRPSPAELILHEVQSLRFHRRQRVSAFLGNFCARLALTFVVAWGGFQAFRGLMSDIGRRAGMGALLTAIIISCGGLILLRWVRERFKPGMGLLVVGYALAGILALYFSLTFAGILTGGVPLRSPVRFIFLWFFLALIAVIPQFVDIRTTVCNIHDGWIRITTGVFRRETLSVPLYNVQNARANQSLSERLGNEANLSIKYLSNAGQSTTAVLRGVGKRTELETLSQQITKITQDLQSGVWRSGVNYLWDATGALRPIVLPSQTSARPGKPTTGHRSSR